MKTYRDCFEFVRAANQWISKHDEESKFKYALTKVTKKLARIQEKWNECIEEANIEHCATDKEGVILRDERGQYKYTKDELIKRNKRVSTLYDSNVEIQSHFATEVPEDLTELEKEVFTGFVLKDEPENEDFKIVENG
jgi:sugar-specific transcriptional regulator TrmB